MDKRMVISAYQRGFISLKECAQILGTDSVQIIGLMNDPHFVDNNRTYPKQKSANH